MGINFNSLFVHKAEKKNVSWFNKILSLAFFVLTILVFSAFWSNFSKLRQAEKKIEEKKRSLEELRRENESIKNRLKEISSEAYIEKQLRDNLAMVKKGEVVVVLPDEETIKSFVPKIDTSGDEVVNLPNWRKWFLFFNF
jgi:cell division protein FtsB